MLLDHVKLYINIIHNTKAKGLVSVGTAPSLTIVDQDLHTFHHLHLPPGAARTFMKTQLILRTLKYVDLLMLRQAHFLHIYILSSCFKKMFS